MSPAAKATPVGRIPIPRAHRRHRIGRVARCRDWESPSDLAIATRTEDGEVAVLVARGLARSPVPLF